jgi:phosphoribosyl 1,2-cyclic phosphodiesterase
MEIKVLASGSKGNCYWVSDGKTNLLLEAGIPFGEIQKGCNFSISHLDGCLITHEHGDHAKAAGKLMKHSIDVYASQGTASAQGWNGHRLHIIKSMERFNIGSFAIMPFDVKHDSAEPLGYCLLSQETQEKLLFVTDTQYVRYRFGGLTHIMCECNYDQAILLDRARSAFQGNGLADDIESYKAKRIMESHMSIEAVLNMLRANDLSCVQQIYLLHLSSANSDAAVFKERVKAVVPFGVEVYVC